MTFHCSACEIEGREKYKDHRSLDQCKSECLKDDECKGIDWGFMWPNHYECYFVLDDVNEVGTTFSVTFKSFRRQTCLGNTLSICDHSSLKVSLNYT